MSDKDKGARTPEGNKEKNNHLIPVGGLGLIVLGCVIAILGQNSSSQEGRNLATVTAGGQAILEVDLNRVESSYELEIGEEHGQYNLILIENGRISVSKANCPDQICVLQGPSGEEGRPILCLPHQVVITLEGEGEADGFSG